MNPLTTSLLPPSRLLYKPMTWIAPAILLAVIDLLSPAALHACVLATFLVPLAWNVLPRRYMPLLMASLLVAVTVPGLFHALGVHPFRPPIPADAGTVDDVPIPATQVLAQPFLRFGADRIWTLTALCGLWWFHNRLQDRRRRRLLLRRILQARVHRRTNQVKRANTALRSEVIRRQQTQHLLDQSESTFQALIERMELQVTRKDTHGVITFANDIYCQKLGLEKSDVIGSTDEELFDASIANKYRADDLRIMRTGQIVDQIESHPTADGKVGFAQVFKAAEYDRDGNCIGIQIIFWDVTRKHLGDIALRNSEARKRALFDSAGDAVILIDEDNAVVEANPAATILFGDALLGKDFNTVARPLTSFRLAGQDESQVRQWDSLPRATRQELTVRRFNGSEFESEVSVHTIPVGDAEGCAVIVRDVTLQKRAIEALRDAKAAAEAANRTKTEFMAGVSHELRTPLGGIAGLTDLLSQTELTPPAQEYVRMIRRSTQALTDVIEDILDFAAIEAGRVEIDPQPIDLHACLGDAYKSLAVRAADKPLQLILSIHPETPRHAVVDPKRFRQIVINLVGNAIKFTPLGEVRVRLSIDEDSPAESKRPLFLLEVADTGVGIPDEKQQDVFTAFERGEIGTKRSFGGTGLGLSISDGLIRRMGGQIDLVSQPTVGSCFSCRVPFPLVSADEVLTDPPTRPDPNSSSRLLARIETGVPNMNSALAETIESLGITVIDDPPDKGRRQRDAKKMPVLWVLRSGGPTTWRHRIQREKDLVIWIQKVGGKELQTGAKRETRLNEPVTPDELSEAITALLAVTGKFTPTPRAVDGRIWAAAAVNEDAQTEDLPCKGDLLLVDDSEVNRLVIRRQLELLGYHVETAVDGEKALEITQKGSFDCILMDLQMPIMDGTEATVRIREEFHRRSAKPPPVVALTAHVTSEHESMCTQAGMVGFVTKPVHVKKLVAAIDSAMGKPTEPIKADTHDGLVESQPRPNEPKASETKTEIEAGRTSVAEIPNGSHHKPASNNATTNMTPPNTKSNLEDEQARERILTHSGGNAEIAVSLCEGFLEEVPVLLRQLERFAGTDKHRDIMRAAHTLKSCLRYVADANSIQVAADVERAAASEQAVDEDRVNQLKTIAQRWQNVVSKLKTDFAK